MIIRLFSGKFRNRNFILQKYGNFQIMRKKLDKRAKMIIFAMSCRIQSIFIKTLNIKQLTKQNGKFLK